jgi:hypothetical protein
VIEATVIMNVYGEKEAYLKEAIDSYISQKKAKLVVSTVEDDACIEYIEKNYPEVEVVVMLLKDHSGRSPNGSFLQLNNALDRIEGDWFCFASSNDYSAPAKIENEIMLCKSTNKLVCYSDFYNVYPEENDALKLISFHSYDFKKHLKGNFVSDCALIHKSLVDKYLPFITEFNNYAYWDLWLRIYEGEGDVFVHNPYPTWYYRQLDNSMHIERRESDDKVSQQYEDKWRMLQTHR